MDKKKIRNDIILIVSLLLVAVIALLVVIFKSVNQNLKAKIYVQNTVVEVVDLSKREDATYIIDGLHGKVKIHTHDGSIAVVESNCPHQDCVKTGYIKESNHPIICAYNAVYVIVEGETPNNDVELG